MAVENANVQEAKQIIARRQREIAENSEVGRNRGRGVGERTFSGCVTGHDSGRDNCDNYDSLSERKKGDDDSRYDLREGKKETKNTQAYSAVLQKGKDYISSERRETMRISEAAEREEGGTMWIPHGGADVLEEWDGGKTLEREERRGIKLLKIENSVDSIVRAVLERVKEELSAMIAEMVSNQLHRLLSNVLGELRGREIPQNIYVLNRNSEEEILKQTGVTKEDLIQFTQEQLTEEREVPVNEQIYEEDIPAS